MRVSLIRAGVTREVRNSLESILAHSGITPMAPRGRAWFPLGKGGATPGAAVTRKNARRDADHEVPHVPSLRRRRARTPLEIGVGRPSGGQMIEVPGGATRPIPPARSATVAGTGHSPPVGWIDLRDVSIRISCSSDVRNRSPRGGGSVWSGSASTAVRDAGPSVMGRVAPRLEGPVSRVPCLGGPLGSPLALRCLSLM
jgi:hypothetical protein